MSLFALLEFNFFREWISDHDKVLVLQHLYNLADDQAGYQIRDRYPFSRFPGIPPEGKVPNAKTIWLFREALKEHSLVDGLFAELNEQVKTAGYIPRQGQIKFSSSARHF